MSDQIKFTQLFSPINSMKNVSFKFSWCQMKRTSRLLKLKRQLNGFRRRGPVKSNLAMFELPHRLTKSREPDISEQLHSMNTCVYAGRNLRASFNDITVGHHVKKKHEKIIHLGWNLGTGSLSASVSAFSYSLRAFYPYRSLR